MAATPCRNQNLLVVSSLPGPAQIDGWADNVAEIVRDDAANEEDGEVVFHGSQLRVVDA